MNKIGIMQGRLTPRNGRSIQFFPFDNWQKEFEYANEIGLNEIEFIFDYDNFEKNPLWSDKKRNELKTIIQSTNVAVNYICADYFMVKPFFRCTIDQFNDNVNILRKLIAIAGEIGTYGIEIPFVDNSSIKTIQEKDTVCKLFEMILPDLKQQNIFIGLETDLDPMNFKKLLERLQFPYIKANYDTGNSSGIGYDPAEEVMAYGSYIGNIHIKDRLIGNGTVELGTGSAQFENFFSSLAKTEYGGSFILQAARGEDGKEKEWIKKQIFFLKSFIVKYFH
jgi:hexulose-6-phosphate isomerase